ncbi:MAG: hypothetical protein HOP10_13160 [Chitinophagaceae bacterium]|nr:hypothetical protein [Chitinophagaceae bacterium]
MRFAWLIFSQAKRRFLTVQNDYFYHMEMYVRTQEIKEVILGDGIRFSYTIKPVKIRNILGAAVGVLKEYFITNPA